MTQTLASPTIDPLDRHQRRREQSIPTISVLGGPVGLGVRRWRAWAARRGQAVVVPSDADPGGVFAAWVRSLAATGDLVADAVAWAASLTEEGPTELRRARRP